MALFGRPTPEDHRRADAWREWIHRQHPLAIISLVLGVFSLVDFGVLIVPAIVSIVLAIVAIRRIRTTHVHDGARLAWTGIALSTISLVIAAGVYAKGMR
ncbi:MAG TPA: DUF4190 domain-containing protein [Tepidisphaeraceae bacterium]|nr:DUF4190 domain-containing protein [Tepidisphaeraceae bacterium]